MWAKAIVDVAGIHDRGWVRLALWDGAIIPPMMSPGSSLTRFWRALQPLIPFKVGNIHVKIQDIHQ
jgi:hypothetical protein